MRTIALLLIVLATPACLSLGCTDVYPIPGVQVTFAYARALPAGDYTIEVHADGVELALPETLDASGSVSQADWETKVTLPDGRHLFLQGVLFANDGNASVGYDEGAGPSQLTIDVVAGGATIAHADLAPSYHGTELNGRGCGITEVANATVPLTP
jgi:hypothetical protein